MKLYKITAIYTRLTDIVKNNAFISIGNISAIFTLNLYYNEYWEPIIYIISSLLIFSYVFTYIIDGLTKKTKTRRNRIPTLTNQKRYWIQYL